MQITKSSELQKNGLSGIIIWLVWFHFLKSDCSKIEVAPLFVSPAIISLRSSTLIISRVAKKRFLSLSLSLLSGELGWEQKRPFRQTCFRKVEKWKLWYSETSVDKFVTPRPRRLHLAAAWAQERTAGIVGSTNLICKRCCGSAEEELLYVK